MSHSARISFIRCETKTMPPLLARQPSEKHEQLLGFARRQVGGRLVQEQDFGADGEGTGDLHDLPFMQRQATGRPIEDALGHGWIDEPQRLGRHQAGPILTGEREGRSRMDDADILGDRQLGQKREFLVDHGDDRGLIRVPRRGQRDRARIGMGEAGDDADEGGFPGAVATEKSMDLAWAEAES